MKLKLDLDDLTVDSFDTTRPAQKQGTVFGEQCTCYTQCTCPGYSTCDESCDGTCAASCNTTCNAKCNPTSYWACYSDNCTVQEPGCR
ncbi:MAG TPA: hypothetical protein VE871_05495 [Longimicrobium sp.]|nr:hypothetical protein [Longimicrobium sp.]